MFAWLLTRLNDALRALMLHVSCLIFMTHVCQSGIYNTGSSFNPKRLPIYENLNLVNKVNANVY